MEKEIEEEYKKLLTSGMFWVIFPKMSGNWVEDEEDFTWFYNNRLPLTPIGR
jgi:hypothetical protein